MTGHAQGVAMTFKNIVFLALGLMVFLSACNSTPQPKPARAGAASATPAATITKNVQISDITFPANSRLDEDESLIIGSDDKWVGRLTLKISGKTPDVYDHFFHSMPELGWVSMTAIQGKVSLLTFSRGDRHATVQIAGGLGGVTVNIFVTDRAPNYQ